MGKPCHSSVEPLDSRQLLSATLTGHLLEIAANDSISVQSIQVWISAQHPTRLQAGDGEQQFSFSRGDVQQIDITGGSGPEDIEALTVHDRSVDIPMRIDGGAGDDTMVGGAGNDTLLTGPGDDEFHGGDGIDTVDYSGLTTSSQTSPNALAFGIVVTIDNIKNDQSTDGIDNVFTDVENVIGSSFRDVITGSGKANALYGGNGSDYISGMGGNDLLDGGKNGDKIIGGSGNDTLDGDDSGDSLYGDAGDDALSGGNGDDLLDGGSGNDSYDGGQGFDSVLFLDVDAPVMASFDGKANDGPLGSQDNFIDFENLNTVGDGDVIDASNLPHGFSYGTTGIPAKVTGSNFDDQLDLGKGGLVYGLGGNDTILAGDTNGGGDGPATVYGGDGNDSIQTGSFDDIISGGNGDDRIDAGAGNDTINGNGGRDSIHGGDGNDFVLGAAGDDHIFGEDGNDTIAGQGTKDYLYGGAGSDSFHTSENAAGWVKDFDQGVDVLI